MPWKVYKKTINGKAQFCVHKKNSDGSKGELVHCHDSAEMARRQQAALYVSENKELEPEDAMIIDEDNDGAEYKEYPEYPSYASSAVSFEQLESEREAQERVHELSELMSDFQNLAGNIVYTPAELLESDKIAALDKLYSEFKSRATDLLNDGTDSKQRTILQKALSKVKEVLGIKDKTDSDTASGLFVWKEANGEYGWITSYSNKFMDRDNPPDIIASTAHKEFVEKVDKGNAPLPDLYLWHVPEWKIGYATSLAYDDSGFPIAIGRFDDNAESKEVAEWLSKQTDFGVSHGMWNRTIQRDKEDPSVIIAYETYEISPLPRAKAANLLADYYVIQNEIKELKEEVDMTIPESKRQELLKRGLPEATLAALEERNKSKAEAAEADGIKSKEKEETQPTTDETQPVPETTEAPAAQAPDATASDATPNIETVPPVEENKGAKEASDEYPTRQEVAEAIASVFAPKFDEISKQFEELNTKLDNTAKQLAEVQTSDEKRIKEIISMTPRDSMASLMAARFTERATSSKQTKVGDNDSLLQKKPREEKAADTAPRTGINFIDKMISAPTDGNK